MFQTIFNKSNATTLREYGFSASEIAEFMGCSKDWVYSVVKQKTVPEKRKELMQYVISGGLNAAK
jgi:predicted DNA-binding transcriptional regulator AlpA